MPRIQSVSDSFTGSLTLEKKMQGCIPPTYTLFLLLLILFEKNYYTSGQIIKVCWSVQMFSETFLQNSKQWGS